MSQPRQERKRRINGTGTVSENEDDHARMTAAFPATSPPRSDDASPPPFSDASDDEALEDVALELEDEDEVLLDEDDDGEDLFGDQMNKDYKEIPHLDAYDADGVDDMDYEQLDPAQRAMIDAQLNKRDRDRLAKSGAIPRAFLADLESDDFADDSGRPARLIDLLEDQADMDMVEDLSTEALTEADLQNFSLLEFVTQGTHRHRIARDYRRFLTSYVDAEGESVYSNKIRAMCAANQESLEVNYEHLVEHSPFLGKLVANVPADTLDILDEETFRVVLDQYEDYGNIQKAIHVRISNLPSSDSLRDLRFSHLNTLVRVSGVVTRRTGVFPQMSLIKYDCGKCGHTMGPFTQDLNEEVRINACSECQSRGPFNVNISQTIYRNYQKVTLQESPGSVPAGRLPRHKDVILLNDLIDAARPGEEIEVTGIYRNNFSYSLNNKYGFPVFATLIEANYLSKKEDEFASFRLTEDDQKAIRELARDERIGQRIISSIAPSIYGHHDIKTAVALAMFGGTPKNIQGKHQLRGDINVLLLGDPGTAKSQVLKYVEKTAHRAVYATGQGASAVGLTASVHKDPVTREWTLEGGALVLADKGVCLIDEFDKMNDADRTSIHEAMEQQSISISKAGIVTTLQARCAVIAAANPIRGRYNPSLPFSQNVELTEPILSRFDVLCVVRDTVDPVTDGQLAHFVVGSHIRSHPLFDAVKEGLMVQSLQSLALNSSSESGTELAPISQEMLKKYIMYAKSKVRPVLQQLDVEKISSLYAELRRESLASGSIPITVRHIESMVRLAEAHARMHLRDNVRSDDIDVAISVALSSFIGAQKFSVKKQLEKAFSKYLSSGKDQTELLLFLLQELTREALIYNQYRYDSEKMPKRLDIEAEDFEMRARELGIQSVSFFYQSPIFLRHGFRFNAKRHMIEKDNE